MFSAQFAGGQSAAAACTSLHLGCDVLEQRVVLTASESDFVFAQGAITGYKGGGGAVEIPATIGGLPVAVIGEHAFEDNIEITSVVIPDSVVLICDYAFSNVTGLRSVVIGNGVTYIGNNAFERIGGLVNLTVGTRATSLPQNAASITIKGKGFVANVPAANTVTFDNGAVGTVTAATATELTVNITTPPNKTGPLKATVTTNIGGASGAAKQVATVVAVPV